MLRACLPGLVLAALMPACLAFAPSTPVSLRLRPSAISATPSAISRSVIAAPRVRAPLSIATGLRMQEAGAAARGVQRKMAAGHKVTYDFIPGQNPTVIYLPGLQMTRQGTKAFALQTWAKRNNQGFFTADYFGCGKSEGDYAEATISMWVEDTVELIKEGPVVLCGSGVGGWVAMHVAQRCSEVKGLVGVAADPDFTTDVVLPKLDDATKAKIANDGKATITWGENEYILSAKLIEDSKKMLVLTGGPGSLKITCPVRLVQGLGDEEIPPDRALKICEVLQSKDVVITYAKSAKHALDDDSDMRVILESVDEVRTPTPYTLHPTPYALRPTPYTLHPTPYALYPTPYTLHPLSLSVCEVREARAGR
ncbi:Alpha/Beta hydrolase protein [Baffinella frigidus]|nr:Alpha/Beta hydrolase protein [Cryptophyta sp. CCMP2293]